MEDEADVVRKAALQASANVPVRSRRRASASVPALKSFSNLPPYLRDNEFITDHYRVDFSIGEGVRSLFRLHNESGNIWTHLFGFLLFFGLTVYMVRATPAALSVPLAFGREHLDTLKLGMQDSLHAISSNMHLLQGNLHGNLHSLQDTVQQNLASLQSTLQSKAHTVHDTLQLSMHALQGGVTTLQDSIQQTASTLTHGLKDTLHDNLHVLQENLHNIRTQLNGHLEDSSEAARHWRAERWPVYVFLAGAMACLLISSVCHLLCCCSQHAAAFLLRLDYTGIVVLIVASFFPPVYYGFMCNPYWRTFYLTTTSAMGAATIVVSLAKFFQRPKFRVMRTSMFAGLGVWGVVPLVHAWRLNWGPGPFQTAILYDLLMGALYLGGAVVYAMRVPERWKPGAFNIMGHSHQIFHVLVVVAAMTHFKAVMVMVAWRDAAGDCPVDSSHSFLQQVMPDLHGLASDLAALEQVWESFKHQIQGHTGL